MQNWGYPRTRVGNHCPKRLYSVTDENINFQCYFILTTLYIFCKLTIKMLSVLEGCQDVVDCVTNLAAGPSRNCPVKSWASRTLHSWNAENVHSSTDAQWWTVTNFDLWTSWFFLLNLLNWSTNRSELFIRELDWFKCSCSRVNNWWFSQSWSPVNKSLNSQFWLKIPTGDSLSLSVCATDSAESKLLMPGY